MKRTIGLVMILFNLFGFLGLKAATPVIDHVHPLNWWAGMVNPELQIMLHGKGIGGLDVELKDAQGIVVKNVVKFDNKNYLIIYVDTKGAPAQKFSIVLKDGKKAVKTLPYELKQREERKIDSFDASDVVYLLMPDRFATGTTDKQKKQMYKDKREDTWDRGVDMARHGGDLRGMIQHLDYLQELGVTALWPTPTLENDMDEQSYHGYAITNYYETDSRFGTNDEYKELVREAHNRGIKVIKDIVFNHCGVRNFLFADRPADDWFNYNSKFTPTGYKTAAAGDPHASGIDREQTIDGWFTSQMPDVNGKNKLFADYLIQASIWWIEYAGIDGFRQDTYPYNDFNLMKRWCHEVEAQYPGFNIVGETWINNNVGVSYWQKDSKLSAPLNSELKTVMDFPLMYILDSFGNEETDEWDHGLAKLYAYITQDMVYADVNHLLTFLANHDTDRFQPTKEKAQDVTRYKQALTLLLTLRGIPQLYVGDEIGMYANKSVNDGALRQDFPGGFPGDKNNAFTAKGRTNLQNEYFDFTKKLLNWRKGNDTVAFGKLTHYAIRNGCYVYARQKDGKTVTVIVNGTSKEQTLDLSIYQEVMPQSKVYDVISEKKVTLGKSLKVPSRGIYILNF
ncbi:MAG: glycoside hydrolase family 13 protein [Bacteroidaceae bacterium]|nr:glycoside hydrolase family 13 protein [Bacteroidaceae bacterium]